jgi:hypothetical protein
MFWLSFALTAAAMLALLVVSPETKFHRAGPSYLSPQPTRMINTISKKDTEQASSEHYDVPSSDDSEGNQHFIVGNGHPSKQQFKLIQRPDSRWKSFLIQDITTPSVSSSFLSSCGLHSTSLAPLTRSFSST